MTTERTSPRRVLRWLGCLVSCATFAAAAHGDWLVTRAGERTIASTGRGRI